MSLYSYVIFNNKRIIFYSVVLENAQKDALNAKYHYYRLIFQIITNIWSEYPNFVPLHRQKINNTIRINKRKEQSYEYKKELPIRDPSIACRPGTARPRHRRTRSTNLSDDVVCFPQLTACSRPFWLTRCRKYLWPTNQLNSGSFRRPCCSP